MDVGVSELKAKLSAYLARAAAGEMLTVTDRGRPIAVISAPASQVNLDTAIEAGWVQAPTRRGLIPVRRWPSRRTVLAALNEDREG